MALGKTLAGDEKNTSASQATHSASLLCLVNTSASPSPESRSNSNTDSDSDAELDIHSSKGFKGFSNPFQGHYLDTSSPISPMTLSSKTNMTPLLSSSKFEDPKSSSSGDDTKQTSGPNIFKKIISRKALIPRLKAFKRVSDELQVESSPLDDEIYHELMITSALKSNTNSNPFKSRISSSNMVMHQDNVKRFELINKANEAWNKNRRVSTSSLESSKTIKSSSRRGSLTGINLKTTITRQKRKFGDNGDDSFGDDTHETASDDGWNHKRRVVSVSNSPILDTSLPTFDIPLSRRNSTLLPSIYTASEDLEMMHLK